MPKTVSIFGSTGSVGQNTVTLITDQPERFDVRVLTARSNWQKLAAQARALKPEMVVIADNRYYDDLKDALAGTNIEIAAGEAAVVEAASRPVDLHVAAIVGIAGLKPVLAAVEAGCDIALANKESLVCGGMLLMDTVRRAGVRLLPVDSEHNAIYQVLDPAHRPALSKVILTASGGPFRDLSRQDLKSVSLEQALKHPNWSMGAKISIDSATMANKALEMIEACYLFDLAPEELAVVIHPQSLIHSMVEYQDGSVLAQLGAADMKIPIGYCLNYPDRHQMNSERLDFTQPQNMSFSPVDKQRFVLVEVMEDIIRTNKDRAIVFNAANEVIVENFLNHKIAFSEIDSMIELVSRQVFVPEITRIEDVYMLDLETRHVTYDIIKDKQTASA
jgi:1-deoxy-D-xylulose-5-phosphate reductoisomerase